MAAHLKPLVCKITRALNEKFQPWVFIIEGNASDGSLYV